MRTPMLRAIALVAPAVAIGLAFAAPAHAHGLKLDCRLGETTVRVEAFFSDGTEAVGFTVTVRRVSPDGEVEAEPLAIGETDAGGACELPRPTAGATIEIEVRDAAGHAARERLEVPAAGETPPKTPSAPPTETRGAVRWSRVAAGLLVIAALGGLLAIAQRRARGAPRADGGDA